jgi:hypothetical protein
VGARIISVHGPAIEETATTSLSDRTISIGKKTHLSTSNNIHWKAHHPYLSHIEITLLCIARSHEPGNTEPHSTCTSTNLCGSRHTSNLKLEGPAQAYSKVRHGRPGPLLTATSMGRQSTVARELSQSKVMTTSHRHGYSPFGCRNTPSS